MIRKTLLVLLLVALALPLAAQEQGDGRYMVKFKDFRNATAAVRAAGGNVALELPNHRIVAAYLPAQAAEALSHNPNVEYVEVDPRREPMAQTSPYGIAMVEAPLVSAANAGAVTVCIIDSGYYRDHEDLQILNVTGTNDSSSGFWYEDTCGHGTHVAGTVAALNNTVGVVGVVGTGGLKLHIEKVFNGSNCAWSYSSNLIGALDRCRNAVAGTNQKLVVSMSLGGTFSSNSENTAFQQAYNAGVLSIAAAGNDGNTRKSYPASYSSVVSVAAVDSNKVIASFSQQNDAVELAAPGVDVVSTTPFKSSSVAVDGVTYLGSNLDGSARADASGSLVNGGLCTSAGSWSGAVVLCERGTVSFADKVNNVKNGGGVAAVIYNNAPGGFSGTLNGTNTIPGISISQEDGQFLVANKLGRTGAVSNSGGVGNGYESYNGTSMATPHVSGVAALVWSNHTSKSNADIRAALQATAEDLGAAGKDNAYGYGLVRAKAAHDYLAGSNPPPPPGGISLTVTKTKSKGKNYANLSWSGHTKNVDIYRNGATIATNRTGTTYSDGPLNAGSYTYKVCETGSTTVCSSDVTVSF